MRAGGIWALDGVCTVRSGPGSQGPILGSHHGLNTYAWLNSWEGRFLLVSCAASPSPSFPLFIFSTSPLVWR